MELQLQAVTAPGARLVALAEELSSEFGARAGRDDRDGRFSFENIAALKRSGYFAAAIPLACGGLGVEAMHDVLVASSRLAQGDPSTTIGVNMHLSTTTRLVRGWQRAVCAGDRERAARAVTQMEAIASGTVIIAAAVTEAGREVPHPATNARRNAGGWLVNGAKIFATMSPAATHLALSLTYTAANGEERLAFTRVPVDAPGITINDDWDALGMRTSGSGSVRIENLQLPADAFSEDYPAGEWSAGLMERYLSAGPMHASASLGIAESAAAQAVAFVSAARKGSRGARLAERPALQLLAAENAIDLAAMRATFSRAGMLIDAYFAAHRAETGALPEVRGVFSEIQAAKAFVHATAIRIVDRALALSGGSGFMSKHPLSRLYRDVRAGPFMQPLSTTAAQEFIGRVTLGLEPIAA